MSHCRPEAFGTNICQECKQHARGRIYVISNVASGDLVAKGPRDSAVDISCGGAADGVVLDAFRYEGSGRSYSFDSSSEVFTRELQESDLCVTDICVTTTPSGQRPARMRVGGGEHTLKAALRSRDQGVRWSQNRKQLEQDIPARNAPLLISITTEHGNERRNEELISQQEPPALAKISPQPSSQNHTQTMSPDKTECSHVEDAMLIENVVTQLAPAARTETKWETPDATSLKRVQDAIDAADAKIEALTPLFHDTAALWRKKYGTLDKSPSIHKSRYSREELIEYDLRNSDVSWDGFVRRYKQERGRYLLTSDTERAVWDLKRILNALDSIQRNGTKVLRLVAMLPGHDERCDATSAPRGARAVHQMVQYGKDVLTQSNRKALEIHKKRENIGVHTSTIEMILFSLFLSYKHDRIRNPGLWREA